MTGMRPTTFIIEPKFLKAIEAFGHVPYAAIKSDMEDFEEDWRSGMEEAQLYARYNFKPLKENERAYKLFQIYVGPHRKNVGYRATLLFYNSQLLAYRVHAFKKEVMNEKQEIALAFSRADETWERINKRRT